MAVTAAAGVLLDQSVGRGTHARQINKLRPARTSKYVTRAHRTETQSRSAKPIPTEANGKPVKSDSAACRSLSQASWIFFCRSGAEGCCSSHRSAEAWSAWVSQRLVIVTATAYFALKYRRIATKASVVL